MSLISALHSELERARLQVNQIVKDQRTDHSEVSHLLKCFAEEKAMWKSNKKREIKSAIESVSNELEVERKMRRRSESLNKKLGLQLAETKASFMEALKELESEKRAREIMEHVCNELAMDVNEDREELKRESVKAHEEVEQEREMLQLADKLREERVQMKLAEAKHQFEEKNALVDKLKSQLEAFLGNITTGKKKGRKDEDLLTRKNEEHDDGDVENVVDPEEEDSGESDLQSIELNTDNNNKKIFKWTNSHHSHQDPVKCQGSVNGRASSRTRRSTSSIQRTGTAWVTRDNFLEQESQTPRSSHGDGRSLKGLRDRILANLKPG